MEHEYDQPHVHKHVADKAEGTTAVSESALNGLLCCPRCGSKDGCHYKMIEKRSLHYDWQGKPCGGSEPDLIRGGTKLYCDDCDLDVTSLVTLDFKTYAT